MPSYLPSYLVKQITIKENALQHAVAVQIFIFNSNSGYVRVQLPQCSFVRFSGP